MESHGSTGRVRQAVLWLRSHVISIVVDVLILLVIAALVRSVVVLVADVWGLFVLTQPDAFKNVITHVLTVFVFIELLHSLLDYVEHGRVRVTHLADASLAFVLREIWVALYSGDQGWPRIVALAVLVLALGAVRTMAVVYSPAVDAAE